MTRDHQKLLVGAALGAVVAGAAGFGLARFTAAPKDAAAEAAKAQGEKASDAVVIDAPRIAAAGIGVQAVAAGGLSSEIPAPGTVAATPDGQAVLTARAAGAVTRIFKRLGDPVRAGETIALVESRDASAIAADRSSAAAKAALAQKVLERERYLYDQKISPRQDLEQAEAEAANARAEARRAEAAANAAQVSKDGRSVQVTSPIAGRITAASARLGAFVPAETELFRVSDPRRIQIEAAVTGADADRVAAGDQADVEVAGRTAPLQATVRAVAPSLDAETRSATVVLDPPAGAALPPGAIVRVRIHPHAPADRQGVVVPEEAIQTVEGRDSVFLRTAQGFKAMPVTLGRRGAGRVEVASGLKPGARIAVKNAFLLKAELGKGAEGEE